MDWSRLSCARSKPSTRERAIYSIYRQSIRRTKRVAVSGTVLIDFSIGVDEFDRLIDRLWQLFNPGSTPEKRPQMASRLAGTGCEPRLAGSRAPVDDQGRFPNLSATWNCGWTSKGNSRLRGSRRRYRRAFPLTSITALSIAGSVEGGVRLWSPDFYKELQLDANSQIGSFQLVSKPEPRVEA